MSENKFDRQRIAQDVAEYERTVGGLMDFGSHASGCPACGGLQRRIVFCVGRNLLATGDMKRECPFSGGHLHVQCACLREWVTRTLDDPDNTVKHYAPASVIAVLAKRFLAEERADIPVAAKDHEEYAHLVLVIDQRGATDCIVRLIDKPTETA